jgi:hypothetical protein
MKLFTKEIDKKLFAQYSMGNNLEAQQVVAKIFNPYGRGVWYLLNSDPNDPDYLWAIVNLHEVEIGSVSRSELESILVPPFRLPLERDLYFTPVNAKVLFDGLLQGKHYAKGGSINVLKENDFVWNALGKKLVVDKVTDDEYWLSGFMQPSASPYSKEKVDSYIKKGEWNLKPKMAKGGNMFSDGGSVEQDFTSKEFDALKKGDKITITYESGISRSNSVTLEVKSKTIVGKGKSYQSEKVTFINQSNPTGVKYYAYKRSNGNVGFAIGDMAIWGVKTASKLSKGGGIGSPLSQAKKKVASMSDSEVAEEVETILAYEMMDYNETGEDLMNDMKSARKFLIEHYEEQFTDIDITPFSNGGGVGYQHDVNIVTNREGENYLYPANKTENSMGVLLNRGGNASEALKETDYISNRKIDAVIIDGKRYDGKSIIDGVYLRKSASGNADVPQPSAQEVSLPRKPQATKPTRKPKPMSSGGELLNPQLAENDAQFFERRFGVSVKTMADKLKSYDSKSVFIGNPIKTYEALSGEELNESNKGAFYKQLLAGLSFYEIKLGKSKAIMLPNFDEQDLDNGLRVHVKPQYAKPLANEGFLSMKNIVGTDTLRPIMSSVYFDNGNLIATDAHKIIIVKQSQSESQLKPIFRNLIEKEVNKNVAGRDADKIIEEKVNAIFEGGLDKKAVNMFTGMIDEGTKYPNYQAVIPKNIEYTESVSIQSLIDACNGVFELSNNCYKTIGIIKFNFINGEVEQEIGFLSEFLLDTLQVLQINGAKSVKLSPSTPTRGCGIYADNGNYALLMPIMSDLNVDKPCNYSIPMKTTESNFIPSESVIANFKYKDGGKVSEAQKEKIATVMGEYGQGQLNIGLSDKKVTNRKQAVAIALSEAGVSKVEKKANGGKIATFKEGDVVKSKDPKDGYGTITEVVGNEALVDFQDKLSNHMRRLSFSDLKKVTPSQFTNRFQISTYMKPKSGWKHKK